MTLRTPTRPTRSRGSWPAGSTVTASVIATLVTAAALTGCAAGQRAQTSSEFSVVDGASANISTIGLRDLGVAAPPVATGYPAAATAKLSLGIVNNGQASDTLVSASSPAAASVVITAPSATSASPSPVGPASTAPSAAGGGRIVIPAANLVTIGAATGSGVVALTNLKNALVAGQSIPVTFTFQIAGTVTVQVPVKLVPGMTGGETVAVSPSGDG